MIEAALVVLLTLAVLWKWSRPTRDHYLLERYGMAEKPPGWNKAVLGYFLRGPELRRPTPEFRGAFAERAARYEAGQNVPYPIEGVEPEA